VGLIEELVITPEGRCFGGGVIDEATSQTMNHRQVSGIRLSFEYSALHLDITETVIGEARMPLFLLPLHQIIDNVLNVRC
jgi:hypothetical protein